MDYIELRCSIDTANTDLTDQITAILGDNGFDSFSEEGEELLAYIPFDKFNESILRNIEWPGQWNPKFSWSLIKAQNWNAVWEENFQPVTINDRCYIHAPFHPDVQGVDYKIIIEPKMSFGTAHHETTALMIEYLLDFDVKNKSVLDMGCGTGVLAILAALKGSTDVTAIDNDEWAYNNSLENIERNNTPYIHVYHGDASLLIDKKFDVIIANINRNILLEDIPAYVKSLNSKGELLMSGFYSDDLEAIKQKAGSLGLKYISCKEKNRWVAASFLNE